MSVRIFRGSEPIDALPEGNRGLAYGDGLFETMRAIGGRVSWWDAHWSRLTQGALRLGIPPPGQSLVRDAAASLLDGDADAVLKLVLLRGGEGRGYAPSPNAPPLWILSRHPLPARAGGPLRLAWCDTRLAVQPALAGIKHCNRLEQVLGRAECDRAGADEGLMRDIDGAVIGATAGNVFVSSEGRWRTPPVDRCGIAGVCRAHLLTLLDAVEQRLSPGEVEAADAVFVCNAVRGILPVAQLGERAWSDDSATAEAMRLLARSHPGFDPDLERS